MDDAFDKFAPLSADELAEGPHPGPQPQREHETKAICPPDNAESARNAAARAFGRAPDHLCEAAFYVCRWEDSDDGKTVLPLAWFEGHGWKFGAWPDSRPIYKLDEVAAQPQAPVVICEGEKAADAAALILPQSICTTSSGGANAAAKSDWRPLAGRRVLIWPDNDEAGRKYAGRVAGMLAALNCSVVIIDAAALAAIDPNGGKREPAQG